MEISEYLDDQVEKIDNEEKQLEAKDQNEALFPDYQVCPFSIPFIAYFLY